MRNVVLTSFRIEEFKQVPFESTLNAELLEYKSSNAHRAIFHLYGNGQIFTEKELEILRNDIKRNLSLSMIGNFAFTIILHDYIVSDDFYYQMVDDWGRRDGGCLWSIVLEKNDKSASGIHYWQEGGMTQIYENILRQHPQENGTVLNRYKTPPNLIRWLNAISRPWVMLAPINRPWCPKPKFYPPFDQECVDRHEGVVAFGYKIIWMAFRSDDSMAVAHSLGINSPQTAQWSVGLDAAYGNAIFITPPIDGWVLAVGWGLPDMSVLNVESREKLEAWSREFSEVQFFGTHRVFESHCWIKAVEGKIVRVYSYIGESGETLMNEGEPTSVEQPYKLIDTNLPEADEDDYWEREDIVFPDEEFVMKIAADWSIDPTELENRHDLPLQGLLGKIERKQQR